MGKGLELLAAEGCVIFCKYLTCSVRTSHRTQTPANVWYSMSLGSVTVTILKNVMVHSLLVSSNDSHGSEWYPFQASTKYCSFPACPFSMTAKDINRFIWIQAPRYKLVICYKCNCGKGNVQGIPDMAYIFSFSLLSCWNIANAPPVNWSGRTPALFCLHILPFLNGWER